MDIYLVRHGKTDGNVARRHQHRDTVLNDVGKKEATAIAKVVAQLDLTHLYTSTQMRAVQTARVIGLECRLIPETYPVFEELKRPEFFIGQRLVAQGTLLYMLKWFFGSKGASMHDGESYADFMRRLSQARKQLEGLPDDSRVAVVSHSVFINFFVAHLCRQKRIGLLAGALIIFKILTMKNTALIHLRYSGKVGENGCSWQVVSKR